MDPTDDQTAAFEAGIKFGSLYHQFAGTPISPASAGSLAAAMEEAIENQPYCRTVEVEMREDLLETAVEEASADYVELTGEFLDVHMTIGYHGVTVEASMTMTDGYPLMALDTVDEGA